MRPNRNVEIHECYFEYTAARVKEAMQLLTAKDRLDDDDIQTVRILTDVYQSLTNIRQECVPSEAEQKPITWTGEYTRNVVGTDEDNEADEDLGYIETSKLVKELSERGGVKTEIAEPYQDKAISVNGPAVILIVTD